MPTLPTYNSKANVTPIQAAPFRNEAAQMAENQNKIMGTVTKIAQQWSDAHDTMQYTDAKAKYGVASTEIQSRAMADPDFKNTAKYAQELEDVKKKSLEGIDNIGVKNRLGQEFEYDNQITSIKIQANNNQKELEYNKGSMKTSLATLYQKKASATTDAERMDYQTQIDDLNTLNLRSGVVNEDQVSQWNRNAEFNAAQNEIYSNPAVGKEKINAGYFDLSAEDKGKLLNEANQIEKKSIEVAEWQQKQTQTKGVIDLSTALQDGTLTPAMVRNLQQQGVIDAESAAIFDSIALNKTYEIPSTTSLAQPDYFIRLLEDTNGDAKQIKKVLNDAATSYADNKIGANQYRYFLQTANEVFIKQGQGINTQSKKQNGMITALKGIVSFFKGKDSEEATAKLFDRYKDGDDPEKIMMDLTNEEVLKINPKIKTFPIEGKVCIDKNGNKLRFFPDGSRAEVK